MERNCGAAQWCYTCKIYNDFVKYSCGVKLWSEADECSCGVKLWNDGNECSCGVKQCSCGMKQCSFEVKQCSEAKLWSEGVEFSYGVKAKRQGCHEIPRTKLRSEYCGKKLWRVQLWSEKGGD